MAVIARASITLTGVVDVSAVYRYYLLQSSTLTPPSAPTTNPPSSSWSLAEPTYTSGSTNSLYTVDLTVFSDNSFTYSTVSLSSSYEAAKTAYNKALAAEGAAERALVNTECIVGTQTGSTYAWTGRASFPSLEDGQIIMYWLPYAGTSTAATLNLTLSGGGTTGAKNVYISSTSRCTTHIAAGNMVQMVYRENVSIGGTAYTGWWISRTLNENTYDRIRLNNAIKAKTAISASRVIVGDSNGFFHLAAGSVFNTDNPILWTGSAIAAAATGSNNYLSFPSCTLRNNTTNTWTATQYKTLYIAGSLAGNTFTVASSNWLITEPTDETLTYISLGFMYSTYQMYLYPEHPMYRLIDGTLTTVSAIAYEAKATAEDVSDRLDAVSESVGALQHSMSERIAAIGNLSSAIQQTQTDLSINANAISAVAERTTTVESSVQALGETSQYVTAIKGVMQLGFVANPDYEQGSTDPEKSDPYVYGIAIGQNVSFEATTEDREGKTYYAIAANQTFALYTSTGWQFWVGGNKIGWFSSTDGRLHTVKQEVQEDIKMGNWLMTDSSGFGIKHTGA